MRGKKTCDEFTHKRISAEENMSAYLYHILCLQNITELTQDVTVPGVLRRPRCVSGTARGTGCLPPRTT